MSGGVAVGFNVFVHGPEGGLERFRIDGLRFDIGSDTECAVRLDGPEISGRHASVEARGDSLAFIDRSMCGSTVDDELVNGDEVPMTAGAAIGIGAYQLRLQVLAGAPDQVSTPPSGSRGAPAEDEAAAEVSVSVRRRIHRDVLENLDLVKLDRNRMNDHLLRAKVIHALADIVERYRHEMPAGVDTEELVRELTHEAIGLGPLERLLADSDVSEIMVVDHQTIYVERGGLIERSTSRFTDEESVRAILERIVAPLGRRIDESSPMLDARLADGSRVNAVISPLALRGTSITIRKFSESPLTVENLVDFGSMTDRIANFLLRSVKVRKNMIISGGTGSGKTTLLNVLSSAIPGGERIVTIEDAAELQLSQSHVVALESRPKNMEGKGQVSIRDLLRNAVRMRPDRIVIGECRGAEALDMLQAMNTGHEGSMTTTHANSAAEALKRIETLALMAGLDLPSRALREQIALSVDVIVQIARLRDGSRRVVSVAEVVGMGDDGQIETREIFGYRRTGEGPDGKVLGEFYATGYLPSYINDFLVSGLVDGMEDIL